MSQVSMTVRMDSQLKAGFDSLCQQFGMSANTAMNVFARAVVQYRKIPFEIRAGEKDDTLEAFQAFRRMRQMADENEFPEMTLDEINEEIKLAREERAVRERAAV